MAEKIEVYLTVNDVVTPLHEISEETLLKIREASKPKPIPVFQVCRWKLGCGGPPRLVIKVTQSLVNRIVSKVGQYMVLNEKGHAVSYGDVKYIGEYYHSIRELRLEDLV